LLRRDKAHRGFTEAGDAELTDRQIQAQSRQKSKKVLPAYVKQTARQVADGAYKRRGTWSSSSQENGEGA